MFSSYEFIVITGFRFNHLMDINQYILPAIKHRLWDTYFDCEQFVTYDDLIHVFK